MSDPSHLVLDAAIGARCDYRRTWSRIEVKGTEAELAGLRERLPVDVMASSKPFPVYGDHGLSGVAWDVTP